MLTNLSIKSWNISALKRSNCWWILTRLAAQGPPPNLLRFFKINKQERKRQNMEQLKHQNLHPNAWGLHVYLGLQSHQQYHPISFSKLIFGLLQSCCSVAHSFGIQKCPYFYQDSNNITFIRLFFNQKMVSKTPQNSVLFIKYTHQNKLCDGHL